MRHQKKTAKFGRTTGPRKALLSNLATSLVLYEKMTTTVTKAKAVRPVVERLVTKGKVKSVHTKQELNRFLNDAKAAKKILDVLGPRYKDRAGGYLRITKLNQRQGDGALLARIEFV